MSDGTQTRIDQEERLALLEEKLLDVFLEEADPDGWIDEAKAKELAAEMQAVDPKAAAKIAAQWKGERYWEKKNANQTMALITRIGTYRQQLDERRGQARPVGDPDERLQQQIDAAEQKVRDRLKVVNGGKRR